MFLKFSHRGLLPPSSYPHSDWRLALVVIWDIKDDGQGFRRLEKEKAGPDVQWIGAIKIILYRNTLEE